MNTDSLRYAGFAPRLASLMLDFIVLLPLTALVFWASGHWRLFDVYYIVPGTLFGLFYSVYLVRRFGGTPGKLLVGIRIRKVDGEPVAYREAFLRYLVDFVLCLLMSIAMLFPVFHMTDAEYQSLSFMESAKRMTKLAPSWYRPLMWVYNVWVWGELIVLLTNRKKRAIHDFIAGTVVVHTSPNKSLQATAAAPASCG